MLQTQNCCNWVLITTGVVMDMLVVMQRNRYRSDR